MDDLALHVTYTVHLHVSGLRECPGGQVKKAGSTPQQRRPEESSCEPRGQAVRSGPEEAGPDGGEGKPRESDCRPDREVRVELQGSELWKRFYEIGTEMIITKAGRSAQEKPFHIERSDAG